MKPLAQASSTHLALLRGVNVGGRNMLPMKALAQIFVESGCSAVRTYIQSGNVVFSAPAKVLRNLAEVITRQIMDQYGIKVPVVIRTAAEIDGTIRNNPFLANSLLDNQADPKMLHVMFLAGVPDQSAVEKLDRSRYLPDAFVVSGREIYLHLPSGVAKSRLTNAYFDSRLSTTSTSRNWATVLKLAEWMGVREG